MQLREDMVFPGLFFVFHGGNGKGLPCQAAVQVKRIFVNTILVMLRLDGGKGK